MGSRMRGSTRAACLAVTLAVAGWPRAAAAASSHAPNWQTAHGEVLCGIAVVAQTRFDPGTQTYMEEPGRGLQCSALGIPRPKRGIGDPVVKLGQGRAGRAQLMDQSQDELISNRAPVTLAPASTWSHTGIVCAVHAASVRCRNTAGHGFTISPGHVHLF